MKSKNHASVLPVRKSEEYAATKAGLLGQPETAPQTPPVAPKNALATLLNGEIKSRQLRRTDDDPEIDQAELAAANARHDAEHGHPFDYERSRVRSAWLSSRYVLKGRAPKK